MPLQDQFAEHFREVEFLDDPLSIVSSGLSAPAFGFSPAVLENTALLQAQNERSTVSGDWWDRRLATIEDGYTHTYEYDFGFRDYSFFQFLQRHAVDLAQDDLSIFDFGCGRGLALWQMIKAGVANPDSSFGLTLPSSSGRVCGDVRRKVLLMDCINLAPRQLFDVVMSDEGAVKYSPLNFRNSVIFGLLQAINFTKDGGLLLVSLGIDNALSESLRIFIERGILENYSPADDFRRTGFDGEMPVLRVLRRVDPEDIVAILKLGVRNVYGE